MNFTVLLPVYSKDCPLLFARALQSVYDNTLQPGELICLVDGPVSSEIEVVIANYVQKYQMKVHRNIENLGLAKTLNIGLALAKFDWIVRADADDYNTKDRFRSIIDIHYALNVDVIGSWADEFDETGKYISTKRVPQNSNAIYKFAKYRNPINHMTVAFKRDLAVNVGGYPDLFLKEDYGLWARLLVNKCKFYNIQHSLVEATTGSKMIRRRGGLKYLKSEFSLQLFLYKIGFTGKIDFVKNLIIRSPVFVLPPIIRANIYKFIRFFT